jgi:hypothetical protein
MSEAERLVAKGLALEDEGDTVKAAAIIRAWLDREPKADLVRWYDAQ